MRISLNWLRQYIEFTSSPEELAELLTMHGLEVESIEKQADTYSHFVVGEVLEVTKHPHADKLTICTVDVGKERLQIICGAPNVTPNQKIAVGLVGAIVPQNQHDPNGKPFTLTQVKIRGIDSFGMICSAYELDLGEDKNGIMVLNTKAKVGSAFSDYLGLNDTVLEIGITPNRPDAMSHVGVAREMGAFLGKKIKIPNVKLRENKKKISDAISINIEEKASCPRYSARVIFNVNILPSPLWMQDRLRRIGIRPINNIVDITNYVLMEIGHPLHAFDYDKLSGHQIVIRHAKAGQSFVTLDHKVRSLRSDTLMVCDSERPVAIAGVMGGESSEISDSTKNILLESAFFDPQSIRRTSKYFGLSTDASQRFERGADPNITQWAVDRAAGLIQEICGGEVFKGILDVYPRKRLQRKISVRVKKTNEILGTTLGAREISSFLKKLEIHPVKAVAKSGTVDKVEFSVPTFRPDLEREIDLIEEVARMYGYDNIETKGETSFEFSSKTSTLDFHDELRELLVGSGYREVITNSMQDLSVASLASDKIVKIANPISKDMAALRTSLIPGMLEVIRNNIFHGTKDIRLFEIGKAYFVDSERTKEAMIDNYIEEDRLLIILSSTVNPPTWSEKPRFVDLYDMKGELQVLFEKIFLDKFKFIPYSTTKALTEGMLAIETNGERAGMLGAVSSELLRKFEIEQDVYVVELALSILERSRHLKSTYVALPKYPVVLRDVALVVDDSLPVGELETEIWNVSKPLLKKLALFDVYAGDQIDTRKKSCAFALEFQSEDHTLLQEEVDRVMQKIIQQVSSKFNASLRT